MNEKCWLDTIISYHKTEVKIFTKPNIMINDINNFGIQSKK